MSIELSRSHLEYWLSLRAPLVLAVANLANDQIVWTLPQARKELREQLAASRDQKTFTIRIPSEQHLGHGTGGLREGVSSTALLLSAESIREASLGNFIESSKLASDPNALIKTEVRRQYREDEVDVVGFYMNPSLDAQVRSIAKREKFEVTLATVQNMSLGPNALFGQLNDAFHIRGAGRDVYVVDKEGRIHTIPAVDEQGKLRPRPDIVSDVHSALGTILSPG